MRIVSILLLTSLLIVGCGPAVSQEELGNVVYEVPSVPGAETPYPLPELKVTTSETDGEATDDGHAH